MYSKSLLCLCFSLLSFFSFAQDCNPVPGAIYGSPNTDERGHTVVAKPGGGGFYVAGSKGDSLMLLDLDLDGNVLNTTTFNLFPSTTEFASDLIVDSEGMLAIVGTSGTEQQGGELYIMRYDVINEQILWLKHYENAPTHYSFSIIEKGDNGNYLVAVDASFTTASHNDAWLFEVVKSNGLVNLAFSQNYAMFETETIYEVIYHNNFIYAVGRFKGGGSVSQFRNAILKLNANDGSPVWVKLGHKAENDAARLYGLGLALADDGIVSITWGDPDGTSVTNTEIFIQKIDFDGNLVWINRYDIPGPNDIPRTILRVDGGYVVLANQLANNDVVMFKINDEGIVLWGQTYSFPTLGNVNSRSGATQIINVNDNLIFTGYGNDGTGFNDIFIVRTESDGDVVDACVENDPTDIPVENIDEPVFYSVQPNILDVNPQITDINTTISGSIMQPTCFSTDTVFTTVEEEICLGSVFEGYTTSGSFIDEFVTGDGCDSVRTLNLKVLNCVPIVYYDLEACNANMETGTQMDYSEFTPQYPNLLSCALVSATTLHRSPAQEYKHSCTPGVSGSVAMCVSSYNSCTYAPGNPNSIVMEFTVTPRPDSVVRFTGFDFYQKSPFTYSWINGDSGINNYPRRYGIRILKNGVEIFVESEINTSLDWTLQEFDFINNDDFRVDGITTFRIELLPYCPIGNVSTVSAWDIDEIRIYGACVPGEQPGSLISGNVVSKYGESMSGVDIALWENSSPENLDFHLTNNFGNYTFDDLQRGASLSLKAHKDDDPRNGVSTLDLIVIQKHLLGITPFDSLQQFIAADANKSNSVTAIDLIVLRKLLLGIIDSLPSNTSWRFGILPLEVASGDMTKFREVEFIESIQPGTTVVDFKGIKVGDLNNDAVANIDSDQDLNKLNSALIIYPHIQPSHSKSSTTINFLPERTTLISGLQFAIQLNEVELISIESGMLNLSAENYHISEEGILSFSWSNAVPLMVHSDDILFTFNFKNFDEESFSSQFFVTEDCMSPEAYVGTNLSTTKIQLAEYLSFGTAVPVPTFTASPNPFQSGIDLNFETVTDGNVQINMYDAAGRIVYSSENTYAAGNNLVHVNGDQIGLKEGIIFVQLITDGHTLVQKVIRK